MERVCCNERKLLKRARRVNEMKFTLMKITRENLRQILYKIRRNFRGSGSGSVVVVEVGQTDRQSERSKY